MAVGNNEAKSVDQKEKARVTAEQVKAQKLSAERLSGLVTPRRAPKEIAKTADELTVAFVGGFVGRGDSSLRGILADDWEILAKALAESQAKKRRHASKSKPAVKVFKPPATAEEIRAQKSSVERLSTPKTSPDSTPTNLSPASFSRSRDFFDGDPPHYRWKHVEGARYCIGLFDEGPADEPGLWKTTPSASHGTHHSFCPKNSAKDNRQDLFEQPKPRATPEQVRRQRRSVARLSGTADPTVKRLARSEFSAKELSGLMGFPVEMPRPLAAVEAM